MYVYIKIKQYNLYYNTRVISCSLVGTTTHVSQQRKSCNSSPTAEANQKSAAGMHLLIHRSSAGNLIVENKKKQLGEERVHTEHMALFSPATKLLLIALSSARKRRGSIWFSK